MALHQNGISQPSANMTNLDISHSAENGKTNSDGLDTENNTPPSNANDSSEPAAAAQGTPVPKPVCKKHPVKERKSAKKKKGQSQSQNRKLTRTSSVVSDDSSGENSSDSSAASDSEDEESEDDNELEDEDEESDSESDTKKRRHRKSKNSLQDRQKNAQASGRAGHLAQLIENFLATDEADKAYMPRRGGVAEPSKPFLPSGREEELDDSSDSTDSDEDTDIRALTKKISSLKAKLADARRSKSSKSSRHKASRKKKPGKSSKSKDKKKPASKVAFKRVDQLWDNTIHNYRLKETFDDPDANEWDQYIFTVRRKLSWQNRLTEVLVDIKSRPLREALSKSMGGVKGISLVEETAAIDPNMLFLYLEESRRYMKKLRQLAKTETTKKARKSAAVKASHLKVLVKYLDLDYADTKKTIYPLLESNMVTFDSLWALFKPNTIVYAPTYGNQDEPRAFKVEYATKEYSITKGDWYCIEGHYLEYDGKAFGMGVIEVDIDSFKGARKISSLSCYPLQYHRKSTELAAALVERGKKFVALRGMHYKYHHGMAFVKKNRTVLKINVNGRVMVDPGNHRRINPNYPVSTVRTKDPDLLSDEEDDEYEEDDDNREDDNGIPTEKYKYKVVQEEDQDANPADEQQNLHLVPVEVDSDGNELEPPKKLKDLPNDSNPEDPHFTCEDLLIASPVVLGFAFSEKLWLEFSVSGISDIEWNQNAFDSLFLPQKQKSIVKALVSSHTFNHNTTTTSNGNGNGNGNANTNANGTTTRTTIDDVIQGKGRGLVAVLHGPPGTGKTLTAEGIAELLQRPLYTVSAGELGMNPRELELELTKILDVAHAWGAVLLLDEADVFLEKRTVHDIHRNALVSIFLRLLEYFQGILFLTTNRVETFDDAFQSRIHVALRYGELAAKAKRGVWKMFLDKVSVMDGVVTEGFSDEDLDVLARRALNGRQIKNSVRTAQALAIDEHAPLSMAHIKRVLDVAEAFDHDLRGGTGYMDAMRSYT